MFEGISRLDALIIVLERGPGIYSPSDAPGRAEYLALLRSLGGAVFKRGSAEWKALHLKAIEAIREGMGAWDIPREEKRRGAFALFDIALPSGWYANDSFDLPAVCEVRDAALTALVTKPVLRWLGAMERAEAVELAAASGRSLPSGLAAVAPEEWPAGWALDRSRRLLVNEGSAALLPDPFRARLEHEVVAQVRGAARGWMALAPVVPSDDDTQAAILAAKSQVFSHLPSPERRELALLFVSVAEAAEKRDPRPVEEQERRALAFEDVARTNFARSHVMDELDDQGKARAAERILAATLGGSWGAAVGAGRGAALDPELYDFMARPHVWSALSADLQREAVGRLIGWLEVPPVRPEGGPPWPEGDVAEAILKIFGRPAIAAVAAASFKERAAAAFDLYEPGAHSIRITAPMERGHGTSIYFFGKLSEEALAALNRAANGKEGVQEVGFEPTKT